MDASIDKTSGVALALKTGVQHRATFGHAAVTWDNPQALTQTIEGWANPSQLYSETMKGAESAKKFQPARRSISLPGLPKSFSRVAPKSSSKALAACRSKTQCCAACGRAASDPAREPDS